MMMMTPTQYDEIMIAVEHLLADPNLKAASRFDVQFIQEILRNLEEHDPDTPKGIYTPTPYHQTGGTDPQQNKEE